MSNEAHQHLWNEYRELEFELSRRIPKSDKERILRRMRVLEKELDIEGRNYNG